MVLLYYYTYQQKGQSGEPMFVDRERPSQYEPVHGSKCYLPERLVHPDRIFYHMAAIVEGLC